MRVILVSVIVVGVAACGKGEPKGKQGAPASGATNERGQVLPRQGACDDRAAHKLCTDYFGQPDGKAGPSDYLKKQCESGGGTYLDVCPKEGALGRCISEEIRIQQVLMYPPMERAEAELICKGMGDGKLGLP